MLGPLTRSYGRTVGAALIVLLATAGLVATSSVGGAASPEFIKRLPFDRFGAVEVDPQHGRVFVTSGAERYDLAILDLSGNMLKRFRNLAGPSDIVINERSVFVLLANFGRILELDRATLAVRATHDVAFPANRDHLAGTGGRLWFSAADSCDPEPRLVGYSPASRSSAAYSLRSNQTSTSYLSCAGVGASRRYPNQLYAWDADHSSPELRRYDVTGSPELEASVVTEIEGIMTDVAVGSEHAYLVGGAPYGIEVHDRHTLERVGYYPMAAYPGAVDVSPDGSEVAATSSGGTDAIWVFDTTTGERLWFHELGRNSDDYDRPAARGLQYHPDGNGFFVVTGGRSIGLWLRYVPRM